MRSLLSEEEMARRQVVLAAFACLCAASIGHCHVQPVVVSTSADVRLDYRSGKAVPVEDLVAALPSEQSHVYCAVFIDDLQLQDFSLFGDAYEGTSSGGVFSNIKSLMENSKSSGVAPSVSTSSSTSLSEALESRLAGLHAGLSVQTVDAHSVDDLASLEHADGSTSLWIVRIPSSSERQDRRGYLARSDELVGALREQLPSSAYTILLTSSLPASADTETIERSPARHLLAVASAKARDDSQLIERTIFAFYCHEDQIGMNASVPADVLISFDNVTFVMENNVTLNLANDGTPIKQLVGCADGKVADNMVVASVDLAGAKYAAKVDFSFFRTNGRLNRSESSNSSFYWELRFIKVVMNDSDVENSALYNSDNYFAESAIGQCYVPPTSDDWVIAPLNFSFSCQPERQWVAVKNESLVWRTSRDRHAFNNTGCMNVTNPIINFTVSGLQVQAFSVQAHKVYPIFFGAPINCVGYFTGPTWMGIIVSLFLIFVLFATSTIFISMETPDRFDDPKGRNIQIGQ